MKKFIYPILLFIGFSLAFYACAPSEEPDSPTPNNENPVPNPPAPEPLPTPRPAPDRGTTYIKSIKSKGYKYDFYSGKYHLADEKKIDFVYKENDELDKINIERVLSAHIPSEKEKDGYYVDISRTKSETQISYLDNSITLYSSFYKKSTTDNEYVKEPSRSLLSVFKIDASSKVTSVTEELKWDRSYSFSTYSLVYDDDDNLRNVIFDKLNVSNKFTWNNDVPVSLTWGRGNEYKDEYKYSDIPNEGVFDLNWLYALPQSEGTAEIVSSAMSYLSLYPYFGNRSKLLAKEVTANSRGNQKFVNEFELDDLNRVIKITTKLTETKPKKTTTMAGSLIRQSQNETHTFVTKEVEFTYR